MLRSESKYMLRGTNLGPPPDTTSSITPSLVPSFRSSHTTIRKSTSISATSSVGRGSVSVIRGYGLLLAGS